MGRVFFRSCPEKCSLRFCCTNRNDRPFSIGIFRLWTIFFDIPLARICRTLASCSEGRIKQTQKTLASVQVTLYNNVSEEILFLTPRIGIGFSTFILVQHRLRLHIVVARASLHMWYAFARGTVASFSLSPFSSIGQIKRCIKQIEQNNN